MTRFTKKHLRQRQKRQKNKKTKCLKLKQNKTRSKSKTKKNKKSLRKNKTTHKFKGGFRRQKLFLQKMCSNNNACLTLGQYIEMTNAYFDNMNLKYAVNPITAVGVNSANGFIRRIELSKNDYLTTTMLKSSKSETSDNLMYEYLVGLFINKYNSIFPCFLQTYACYQYKNNKQYNKFSNNLQSSDDLKTLLPLYSYKQKSNQQTVETLVNQSCDKPKHICLLIQYFENPIGLEDLLSKLYKNDYFCRVELIQILLQICIPLGMMETTFTHNDLHTHNVLIYTIPDGKYVTMTYKTPFGNVTLKTRYVCKIIDYGRCYFKDDRMSSENILKNLCANAKCGSDCDNTDICQKGLNYYTCGDDAGYTFVDTNLDSYNMSAIINNPGKDLWLIQIIKDERVKFMSRSRLDSNVRELVNSVPGSRTSYGLNYLSSVNNESSSVNIKDFMKKAIVCFNKILPEINTWQSAELDGITNYGTLTVDAITNVDYTFEMNYE
jgi:hypothetical protein